MQPEKIGKQQLLRIVEQAHKINLVYAKVATGKTRGSGGSYYADGKGTLCAVSIPVDLLEELAGALGEEIYPRVRERA